MVLASASPRRRELLGKFQIPFDVIPAQIEETLDPNLEPGPAAEKLAREKAEAIASKVPGKVVLAADTIVVVGKQIRGKASDRKEALEILQSLSGSRHKVITGFCVIWPDGKRDSGFETTFVTMRKISPQEIEDYLDSEEWKDKAGAYAIQETADRFVCKIEGSFDNVVGLPTERLASLLARLKENR